MDHKKYFLHIQVYNRTRYTFAKMQKKYYRKAYFMTTG